jgi:hypothetical protein
MSDKLKIKFNSFHAQNIQAVNEFANNMPSHPVDRNALETWRTEMLRRLKLNYEGTDLDHLSEFVNRFVTNLTHVSYVEFLSNFHNVLDDSINRLSKKPKNTIILTMEHEINKSTVWMSLLAWEKIRDIVTYVMSYDDLYQYITDHPNESISILYIDDASYSGDQAYVNIQDNIIRDLERYNVETIFIIPYISITAGNLWYNNIYRCRVWYSDKAVIFKKLYRKHEVDVEELTTFIGNHLFWSNYFGLNNYDNDHIPNLFTIYFDHKLADMQSIYTQIIAYSPLIPENGYNFDDVQLGNGFITGCVRRYKEKHPNILFEQWYTADKEQPLCPRPIYKALGYTFDKKSIGPDIDLLEWLKVHNYMCINCGIDAKFLSGGTIPFCGVNCQISWYKIHPHH